MASWSRNMQWAAVTTYLLATKVPPQNWPPLERRAAIQGYLFFWDQERVSRVNINSYTYRVDLCATYYPGGFLHSAFAD